MLVLVKIVSMMLASEQHRINCYILYPYVYLGRNPYVYRLVLRTKTLYVAIEVGERPHNSNQ